ncbi:hypothetical protein PsorP6_012998 [Peronosclerospora sorghi]|uniref:Uncharacterized protein n=1 Tax=Peronosclerospora sorghi TaxID=230839 RepID=A0ACC0WEZ2_9STRA|nr:hypothetical protein PsorP6_012998 [Peronosclerospora sorghi]
MFSRTTRRRVSADTATASSFYTIVDSIKMGGRLRKSFLRKNKKRQKRLQEVRDTDFGPASKVLGTLLVEHDSDTIIVYGDDDRHYPPQLSERVLYYTHKYPNDAIAVLGGWISAEDRFYCGRSLAVGLNSVSFVGGAGGVAVKRKFYGLGKATLPVFQVANMSKACFLEMITIYPTY